MIDNFVGLQNKTNDSFGNWSTSLQNKFEKYGHSVLCAMAPPQHRQLLSQSNEARFDMDASPIHERWCDEETMELITAYISTMLQQDLDNLILVFRDSQVQGCPTVIDWIHINAFGQQKPHSLTAAWGQIAILA